MDRLNVISLGMENVEIEKVGEIDFERLKSNIGLLAQQPPVKVYPSYRGKEIDYETGFRHISVELEFRGDGRPNFIYRVSDRASVRGSVNHSDQVGMKSYTQEEVDELRGQRS